MKYPAWSVISVKGAVRTICVLRFTAIEPPQNQTLLCRNSRKCNTSAVRTFGLICMFSSRVPTDLEPNLVGRLLARLRAARAEIINLTESNPTEVGLTVPDGLLQSLSYSESYRYQPEPLGLPVARKAVVEHLANYDLAVSRDRVVLTAGTSEGYGHLFKLLCDPGDAVMVPRPSYPLFDYLTRLEGVRPVPYRLDYKGRWYVDVNDLQRRLTPRTRAVMMVNPNNPTGSFVSADEFDVVTNLCRNHDLALIVDEVFVTYPMATQAMRMSVLRRTPEVLTFSLGGLSKAVGLPQIKLGWITVGGPLVVVEQALSRLELICDTYLSVGTPGQIASPQLFRVGAVVADRIRTRLRANYGKLRQLVRGYQSVQLLAIDGGWYAVLQVPTTQSEEELVLALLERDRVLVHPGYFFDFPREAFLIISLLQKPHVFELGVKKLLARVAGSEGETIKR